MGGSMTDSLYHFQASQDRQFRASPDRQRNVIMGNAFWCAAYTLSVENTGGSGPYSPPETTAFDDLTYFCTISLGTSAGDFGPATDCFNLWVVNALTNPAFTYDGTIFTNQYLPPTAIYDYTYVDQGGNGWTAAPAASVYSSAGLTLDVKSQGWAGWSSSLSAFFGWSDLLGVSGWLLAAGPGLTFLRGAVSYTGPETTIGYSLLRVRTTFDYAGGDQGKFNTRYDVVGEGTITLPGTGVNALTGGGFWATIPLPGQPLQATDLGYPGANPVPTSSPFPLVEVDNPNETEYAGYYSKQAISSDCIIAMLGMTAEQFLLLSGNQPPAMSTWFDEANRIISGPD